MYRGQCHLLTLELLLGKKWPVSYRCASSKPDVIKLRWFHAILDAGACHTGGC